MGNWPKPDENNKDVIEKGSMLFKQLCDMLSRLDVVYMEFMTNFRQRCYMA